MISPEKFREYARECLKWAASEPDKVKRQALIDTASMWTQAALKLEGLAPAEPKNRNAAAAGSINEA